MKSEMYSRYAEQYDQVVQNNIYNAHLDRPSLLALMDDVATKDCLDLGCGSGVYAEYLLSGGAKSVTGIDASGQMIRICKDKLGDRARVYAQDLAIGLPEEMTASKDVIICPLVLHYIEDLSALFADIARVLRPGGYMVFSTHHPFADFEYSHSGNYFERERVEQEWNTVGEPVPVTFYRRSLTELSDAITTSGLMISRISEGKVSEAARSISEDAYHYLSRNPNFIFIRCQKLPGPVASE